MKKNPTEMRQQKSGLYIESNSISRLQFKSTSPAFGSDSREMLRTILISGCFIIQIWFPWYSTQLFIFVTVEIWICSCSWKIFLAVVHVLRTLKKKPVNVWISQRFKNSIFVCEKEWKRENGSMAPSLLWESAPRGKKKEILSRKNILPSMEESACVF